MRGFRAAVAALALVALFPLAAQAQSFDPGKIQSLPGEGALTAHELYERLTFDVAEALSLPHSAEPESLGRRWLGELILTLRQVDADSPAWIQSAPNQKPSSTLAAPRLMGSMGLPYRFDASVAGGLVGLYPSFGFGLKHLLVEGTPRAPGIVVGATAAALWGESAFMPAVASLYSHFCWQTPIGQWSLGARQLLITARGDSQASGRHKVNAPLLQLYLAFQWGMEIGERSDVGLRADATLSRLPLAPFSSGPAQLGQWTGGVYLRR